MVELAYPFWVVEGKVYDLTPFIKKHPGGTRWFSRSHGRDITAAVLHYHADASKLRPILAKYEVEGVSMEAALDPSLNVPRFILPEGFDAREDTPEIVRSSDNDGLLADVNQLIHAPQFRSRIRCADLAFDGVAILLLVVHLALAFPILASDWAAGWPCAILLTTTLATTRTALAAVGHYHCHRAKDGYTDWGDALFDIQYVGASLVLCECERTPPLSSGLTTKS
jgi:hypothetical protein